MSVVIIGGNECMERRYTELCRDYNCKARVITKAPSGLKNRIGNPDIAVFFTNTMSHKMVNSAASELKGKDTIIERCHSSSLSALKSILEKYVDRGEKRCQRSYS